MMKREKTILLTTGVTTMIPGIAFAGGTGSIDTRSTAWMLVSTALVLLMIPGLAMFYGGLVKSRNVLSTMMHSFVSLAIIGVLWFFFVYCPLCHWVWASDDWLFNAGAASSIVCYYAPQMKMYFKMNDPLFL